jgi:hypothetical protein
MMVAVGAAVGTFEWSDSIRVGYPDGWTVGYEVEEIVGSVVSMDDGVREGETLEAPYDGEIVPIIMDGERVGENVESEGACVGAVDISFEGACDLTDVGFVVGKQLGEDV